MFAKINAFYEYANAYPSSVGANYTFVFLPGQPITAAKLSLKQSWQLGGLYIFLDSAFDLNKNASALQNYLNNTKLPQNGFIWISQSQHFGPETTYQTISLTSNSDPYSLNPNALISCGNLQIVIAAPTSVTLDTAAKTFTFNNLSLDAPTIYSVDQNSSPFGSIGPSLVSPSRTLTTTSVSLSLAEDDTFGCWQFEFTLEKDYLPQFPGDIDRFGLGLRYFYPGTAAGDVESLHYPVLSTRQQCLSLNATLDLLNVLTPSRSYFSFPSNAALPSFFTDRNGNTFLLVPQTGASLVFAGKPSSLSGPVTDYYVVPQGAFDLTLEGPGAQPTDSTFALSVSASEYLSLPLAAAQITFVPGQNAYFAGPGSQLSSQASTAWAALGYSVAGSDLCYFRKPQSLVFYTLPPGIQSDAHILDILEIPLGSYQPALATPVAYPMGVYAGILPSTDGASAAQLAKYQDIESNALAGARYAVLEKLLTSATPADGDTVTAVTSIGTLATFSQDLTIWISWTLALGENGSGALDLQDIAGPFKQALFANDAFFVIADPAILNTACSAASACTVELGGWSLELGTGVWQTDASYGNTLMLIKYHRKPLSELIGDTTQWSWPEVAGTASATTLQAFFSAAIAADPYYAPLNDIYNDPNWQGVLFLNAAVSLATFPDSLAMLEAGISNPDALHAPYLIFDFSAVDAVAGQLQLEPTASSFYVRYRESVSLIPGQPYAYEVTSLDALMINSQLAAYQSSLVLQMNELFGHAVSLDMGSNSHKLPANTLMLSGSSEKQGLHSTCSFTNSHHHIFTVNDSTALNTVTVDKVIFTNASGTQNAAQTGSPVHACFIMQGTLSFAALGGSLDLLAYQTAAFDDLDLNVSFLSGESGATEFLLDPSRVTFDNAASQARPASLAKQFPAQLSGMSYSTTATPASQGFIPVSILADAAWNAPLQADWYGLIFTLNLGSLGNLAPGRSFNAQCMVAWSPNPPQPGAASIGDNVWLGLKLPDVSSSGAMFELEGILQFGLESIWLQLDGEEMVISLKDIGLHFLGKTIPAQGQTDIKLFGNTQGNTTSLAWYGAYQDGGS